MIRMNLDQFPGVNQGFVLELYDKFKADPTSVDPATRELFANWRPEDPAPPSVTEDSGTSAGTTLRAAVGLAYLAESIRRYGHLAASIDPLGAPPIDDPSLYPDAHGLTVGDLERLPASLVGGPAAEGAAHAGEAIDRLRAAYCSTIGFDLAQMFVPEERRWLRHAVESRCYRPPTLAVDEHKLLDRMTQVEAFERFLHRTFPGKTRFSVEGLDMLVPILDEIVTDAASEGIQHMLIGMAHRGRLNVLAHVLEKPYAQILAEFKDPVDSRTWRIDLGWTGDVKYHAGARVEVADGGTGHLTVSMAPNPSHLEAVNPVVVGMARAAGTQADQPGSPTFNPKVTLPVLIHGDSAFPGQGVVAETLNLARLPGYDTGGTIHIIANNQIGFTANSNESYSTSYASGLARGFKMPILHVNADDPIACIEAARMASAYRAEFGRDFLIDLVGYRRHGHNEGDEPAFTQPLLYQQISMQPTVRERYVQTLKSAGFAFREEPDAMVTRHMGVMEQALKALQPEKDVVPPVALPAPPGVAGRTDTAVPVERLRELNEALVTRPRGFTVHRKLERGREKRWTIFENPDEASIDWATAEELALASIVADGVPIRFTGEDVGRGTFSQRHAVLRDAASGDAWIPLQSFPLAKASFEIHNSPLTENATIGFEFGYNVQCPNRLVIWEAQYGDFINGAQVIMDQFVTSARAKWGQTPSLVFLLPHGYEGQGPEHSSARPERFLQAAADINLRLVNCSTAAQYFHVLRRQAALLTVDPLPLFVLTPKSLLRNTAVASSPRELAEGRFQPVIDDPRAVSRKDKVTRVVLCSGKIYVDLDASEKRVSSDHVAVGRVEQLYPFPSDAIRELLAGYRSLREIVWAQEEPSNMGAWEFVRPLLEKITGGKIPLHYAGRSRSASPSEGSAAWHQLNQKSIIELALSAKPQPPASPLVDTRRVSGRAR